MSWVFHFRNLDQNDAWFSVQHWGCGGTPWYDGRPKCWHCTIPNNPTGGHDSVYNPSDWVVGFDGWFRIIQDGLQMIADTASLIASEGTDAEAIEDVIKDSFDITQDTLNAVAGNYFAEHTDLATAVQQSATAAAQAVGTTPERIQQIAETLGLGPSGWVFVGGQAFVNLVHNDNRYNDNSGWSLIANPHNELGHEIGNVIAEHCFISGGQLIFAWDSSVWGSSSKKIRPQQFAANQAALAAGKAAPFDMIRLWDWY